MTFDEQRAVLSPPPFEHEWQVSGRMCRPSATRRAFVEAVVMLVIEEDPDEGQASRHSTAP